MLLIHDALTDVGRRQRLRTLLGPTVLPPDAVLFRYRLRVYGELAGCVAEARRHP
jgi:hypothetical protein